MGNLRLYGSTSGYVEIAPPAVGGSQVLTLPTDTVQPGMVLINTTTFSAASTVSVNNCFTSAYQNYKIQVTWTAASTTNIDINMKLRASGVDDSSSNYRYQNIYNFSTTVGASSGTAAFWGLSGLSTTYPTASRQVLEISGPAEAAATRMMDFNNYIANDGTSVGGMLSAWHLVSSAFDGFTIFASTGNFTGTVRIYGYRNS